MLPGYLCAQELIRFDFQLNWSAAPVLAFEGQGEFAENPLLPIYSIRFPLKGPGQLTSRIEVESSEAVIIADDKLMQDIPSTFVIGSSVEQERGKYYGRVWIMPVIATGDHLASRILSGTLMVRFSSVDQGQVNRSGPQFKENSLLADGIIHKVSVKKVGVYKLDYNFIKDKLKIDPASFSADRIAVFGNGDGRVAQWN